MCQFIVGDSKPQNPHKAARPAVYGRLDDHLPTQGPGPSEEFGRLPSPREDWDPDRTDRAAGSTYLDRPELVAAGYR